MVNIPLDSKITLTSDSRQWILNENGRAVSFHQTIGDALNYYLEGKLKCSEAKNIQTLLLRQKQLYDGLCKVVAPYKLKVEGLE